MTYRPAFTTNPVPASDVPPGERVAGSDQFSLGSDVRRIRWDTSADYVRLN